MRTGHGKTLTYYDIGATPFFALQRDPRFSYCLYVPEDYREEGEERYRLIVLVHGTERAAGTYRDAFIEFADRHRCIILAPLFPANTFGPGDLDNYKLIDFGGVRYDRLLLDMVDEVAAKYRLEDGGFFIHGFSGGGHFSHRFLFLHPERVAAVSVGAPGVVTLLDETRDFWVGVRDLEQVFGIRADLASIAATPLQGVVGDRDTDTWEITIPRDSPWWMEGADLAGATRIDRMRSLCGSLEAHGASVRLDLVPGVGHNGWQVLDAVRDFFSDTLVRLRSAGGAAS